MTGEGPVRVDLLIVGRTRDCFYRTASLERAQQLNLTGYIRRIAGETLECVVQGLPRNIGEFVAWCRTGTPGSQVDEVRRLAEGPPDPGLTTFRIAG